MHQAAVATLLIGGEWVGEADTVRANPARPSEVVVISAKATASNVDDALEAAVEAAPGWRRTSLAARGEILTRAAELMAERRETIAAELCAEEGETLREAPGEIARATDILRFFGGEGWRLGSESLLGIDGATQLLTRKEPLGVVAVIMPRNFPIAIPSWKIAPVLVGGNAVISKPVSRPSTWARDAARDTGGSREVVSAFDRERPFRE